jgi:hypothetical protein
VWIRFKRKAKERGLTVGEALNEAMAKWIAED